MGPNTTFFSYARSDSDFALKLASDLRQAGADVWLDQLDIKSGSRWDLSIESSLKKSSKMLVILSPESVSSNNVMDEVSFALEEGKTVIPVLFKSCEIPFRLRRLQHADFTKNYDQALNNLLLALNLGKGPSSLKERDDSRPELFVDQKSETDENKRIAKEEKIKAHSEADKQVTERILNAQDKAESNEKERKQLELAEGINIDNDLKKITTVLNKTRHKYKTPIIISGFIVVLFIITWIVIAGSIDYGSSRNTEQLPENPDQRSAEMLAWNDALVINSMDGFKAYQINYPYGSHFIDAQFKIDSIEAAVKPVTGYEEPTAKKVVKKAQSRVEIQKPSEVKTEKPVEVELQKPVSIAEKRFNLTGRWLTDENLEWKIVQTSDNVEITFCDKSGNPTITVEGKINGNILYYRKPRRGNDLEGKFTISEDGNSLDGSAFKIAGVKNNTKITRIQ